MDDPQQDRGADAAGEVHRQACEWADGDGGAAGLVPVPVPPQQFGRAWPGLRPVQGAGPIQLMRSPEMSTV